MPAAPIRLARSRPTTARWWRLPAPRRQKSRRPSSIATRGTPRARRSPNRAPWFLRSRLPPNLPIVTKRPGFSGRSFLDAEPRANRGILIWPEGLPILPAQVSTLQCPFYCRYHAWSLDRFKRRRKSVPRSPASFEGVGRSIMLLPPLVRPRRTSLSVTLCLVLATGVMTLWHGAAIAADDQPAAAAPARAAAP